MEDYVRIKPAVNQIEVSSAACRCALVSTLTCSFILGARLVSGSHLTLWHTRPLRSHQQPDIVTYCQSKGIALEAYSPLVQGSKAEDPVLTKIAEETGKSWAQVLIRWSLQRG